MQGIGLPLQHINNVQEYYDYAAQLNIGTPADKLRILLTNEALQGVAGATPMFAKRWIPELPENFLISFVIRSHFPFSWFTPWIDVLKQEIDVTIGYNRGGTTANSDALSEVAFHELTHAAHYNKVGNALWSDYVEAVLFEMNFSNNPPYGNGNAGARSDIIALGESWAYHMGQFLADQKYGLNSSETDNGQFRYVNNSIIPGSSHINALEDFSPDRLDDPDRWIPQGLYYDLMDNRNDNTAFPVRVLLEDQVTNYTNQQFFDALDDDIRSLRAFQTRLLFENGNNQAAGVNTIFDFYVR